MSKFEAFKEKFREIYPDKGDEGLYRFIEDYFELQKNPLNGICVENGDEEAYDSYGSEDSKLKRVMYFPDFDIYVMFSGTRASYEGEEWTEMKEVKKKEITISVYE